MVTKMGEVRTRTDGVCIIKITIRFKILFGHVLLKHNARKSDRHEQILVLSPSVKITTPFHLCLSVFNTLMRNFIHHEEVLIKRENFKYLFELFFMCLHSVELLYWWCHGSVCDVYEWKFPQLNKPWLIVNVNIYLTRTTLKAAT